MHGGHIRVATKGVGEGGPAWYGRSGAIPIRRSGNKADFSFMVYNMDKGAEVSRERRETAQNGGRLGCHPLRQVLYRRLQSDHPVLGLIYAVAYG